MRLAQLLYSQGFGTRRECARLLRAGLVSVAGAVVEDPDHEVDTAAPGPHVAVRGEPWTWRATALLVLNKPAGYECSLKPRHHPAVHTLLPEPLRTRGVQPIGRLDEDTTGALLFTDDGPLIHRLTSPKHHVPKRYEVTCRHPVDAGLLRRLQEGVVLHDDVATVRAEACEATGERTLALVLTEGKYHQVKRMVAAAGNRVEALHRSRFGAVGVEGLDPGRWRWLSDAEEAALRLAPRAGAA